MSDTPVALRTKSDEQYDAVVRSLNMSDLSPVKALDSVGVSRMRRAIREIEPYSRVYKTLFSAILEASMHNIAEATSRLERLVFESGVTLDVVDIMNAATSARNMGAFGLALRILSTIDEEKVSSDNDILTLKFVMLIHSSRIEEAITMSQRFGIDRLDPPHYKLLNYYGSEMARLEIEAQEVQELSMLVELHTQRAGLGVEARPWIVDDDMICLEFQAGGGVSFDQAEDISETIFKEWVSRSIYNSAVQFVISRV